MNLKFREGVSEEVQDKVRTFMHDVSFTEFFDGVSASYAPLYQFLVEVSCHAVFHGDYMEIMPMDVWVKEEIASWPPNYSAYYGYILHDYLVRAGFPIDKVNEWMRGENG